MNIQQTTSEAPTEERINRVTGLEELEELIDLAATISNNIDSLERKRIDRLYNMIICLFGLLIISFFLLYEGKHLKLLAESAGLSSIFPLILAISFALPFVIYLFKSVVDRARLAKEIYFESLILDDLFNKLHAHKQTVFTHLGVLKKEIIIFKLNRIKFSNSTTASKRKNTNSSVKRVVDFV